MELTVLDWTIIAAFFVISLVIGIAVSAKSGSSASEFFLSGRNMPWWLLGVSMVATTFSADTPNLVTDIVRQNGVAGNWVWWAFLPTGMLTVFVYAKLWRRLGVMTDLEFYEMRYSGKAAAFLRGFRAIYLGVFFNVMIMASVSLAAIKIGGIMLNLKPVETLVIASVITVIYSSLGGLRGVLFTDFFQFFVAMAGSVWAAYIALNLPQVNGLSNLLANPEVQKRLSFIPDLSNTETLITLFIIPLAVQWWAAWYPGAEPGGGGYIAQRMLSAKSENHAIGATLFFNAAHYALRPWPWILVAFASLVVFPTLPDIQRAFPHLDPKVVQHDLAYPAMLTFLPAGVLGLVVASLIAAFMSTISTHLNWGSSYIVNDFYQRFVNPTATDKQLVNVGRLATVLLMVASAFIALLLENALQAFQILLQIGAGTGLLFILRWFWKRVNAYSEIAAMVFSFAVALYFNVLHDAFGFAPIATHWQFVIGVFITTAGWIGVTLLTPPTDQSTLNRFFERIGSHNQVPLEIWAMLQGCVVIYTALFATGKIIYGDMLYGGILGAMSVAAAFSLYNTWKKIQKGNS